jgi:hypothetical protein
MRCRKLLSSSSFLAVLAYALAVCSCTMYPVSPLWTIPIEALLLDTITGKPLPIASSVVMPNVSVLDGKRKTSELA